MKVEVPKEGEREGDEGDTSLSMMREKRERERE